MGDLAARWGAAFLPGVAQTTLFLAIVLAVLWALRRHDPRIRRAVAGLGILKLLIPPFVTWTSATPATPELVDRVRALAIPTAASETGNALALMAGVWLAGVLVVLAYAAHRRVRAIEVMTRVDDAAVRELGLELPAGVEVRVSGEHPSPMLVGLRRPTVVVPPDWLEWSEARRRASLAHEIAHYENRDHYWLAVRWVGVAVYWFHPLAWIVAARFEMATEAVCDRRAVSDARLEPREYGRMLLDVAESALRSRRRRSLATPLSRSSALERRLRELMQPHPEASPRRMHGVVGALLVLFLLSSQRGGTEAVAGPGDVQVFLASTPASPIDGLNALASLFAGKGYHRVGLTASDDEAAINVRLAIDTSGRVTEAEHVSGGCQSSFAELRGILEQTRWEPARSGGVEVPATIDLSAFTGDQ